LRKGGVSLREQVISAGIDIGTSTTQLVFSRITVENMASSFSIPRITIVDKEIIYRSNIYFTPLISKEEIDGDAVRNIIEKEYRMAGISKEQVKTGAVIITGETARKDNASNVLDTLSGFAGDFVVATAGPDLESIIAGKGAGADKLSKSEEGIVVNLDIGGGTTNIAVFNDGDLVDTGCLDVGGRLIKIDRVSKRIIYIAPKVKNIITDMKISLKEGASFDKKELEKIVNRLAELLLESINFMKRTDTYEMIITNKGIHDGYKFDYVTFSGGVADYVYNGQYAEEFKYGDIGILLGRRLRQLVDEAHISTYKSDETIRATVVGAASHTTDISGSTITYDERILPVKNLPILKLSKADEAIGYKNLSRTIREKVKWFDLENEAQQLALAINGVDKPSFKDIQDLSAAIIEGLEEYRKNDFPIYVVVEKDIAKVLGQTLNAQLNHSHRVVCIDSIQVQNGDYIDIGNPMANGRVVPVVIKTLVLNS